MASTTLWTFDTVESDDAEPLFQLSQTSQGLEGGVPGGAAGGVNLDYLGETMQCRVGVDRHFDQGHAPDEVVAAAERHALCVLRGITTCAFVRVGHRPAASPLGLFFGEGSVADGLIGRVVTQLFQGIVEECHSGTACYSVRMGFCCYINTQSKPTDLLKSVRQHVPPELEWGELDGAMPGKYLYVTSAADVLKTVSKLLSSSSFKPAMHRLTFCLHLMVLKTPPNVPPSRASSAKVVHVVIADIHPDHTQTASSVLQPILRKVHAHHEARASPGSAEGSGGAMFTGVPLSPSKLPNASDPVVQASDVVFAAPPPTSSYSSRKKPPANPDDSNESFNIPPPSPTTAAAKKKTQGVLNSCFDLLLLPYECAAEQDDIVAGVVPAPPYGVEAAKAHVRQSAFPFGESRVVLLANSVSHAPLTPQQQIQLDSTVALMLAADKMRSAAVRTPVLINAVGAEGHDRATSPPLLSPAVSPVARSSNVSRHPDGSPVRTPGQPAPHHYRQGHSKSLSPPRPPDDLIITAASAAGAGAAALMGDAVSVYTPAPPGLAPTYHEVFPPGEIPVPAATPALIPSSASTHFPPGPPVGHPSVGSRHLHGSGSGSGSAIHNKTTSPPRAASVALTDAGGMLPQAPHQADDSLHTLLGLKDTRISELERQIVGLENRYVLSNGTAGVAGGGGGGGTGGRSEAGVLQRLEVEALRRELCLRDTELQNERRKREVEVQSMQRRLETLEKSAAAKIDSLQGLLMDSKYGLPADQPHPQQGDPAAEAFSKTRELGVRLLDLEQKLLRAEQQRDDAAMKHRALLGSNEDLKTQVAGLKASLHEAEVSLQSEAIARDAAEREAHSLQHGVESATEQLAFLRATAQETELQLQLQSSECDTLKAQSVDLTIELETDRAKLRRMALQLESLDHVELNRLEERETADRARVYADYIEGAYYMLFSRYRSYGYPVGSVATSPSARSTYPLQHMDSVDLLRERLAQREAQLFAKTNEILSLEQELVGSKGQVRDLQRATERGASVLQERNRVLESEKGGLEMERLTHSSEMRRAAERAQVAEAERQVTLNELRRLKAQHAATSESLEEATRQRSVAIQEAEMLRRKQSQTETQMDQATMKLSAELKQREAQIEDMRHQVLTLQQVADSHDGCERLRKTLQGAASESEARAKKLQMDLGELEERLRDQQHRTDSERQQSKRQQSEIVSLEAERERLDGERRSTGEWAQNVQEEIQAKTCLLDNIERLLKEEQAKESKREAEVLALKQQLSASRDEVLSLQQRLLRQEEAAKAPIAGISPPRSGPTSQIAPSDFELSRLQEKLSNVETENQRLRRQREEQLSRRSQPPLPQQQQQQAQQQYQQYQQPQGHHQFQQHAHAVAHNGFVSIPSVHSVVSTPLVGFAQPQLQHQHHHQQQQQQHPPRPTSVSVGPLSQLHPTPLPSPAPLPPSLPPPTLMKAEQQIAQMTNDLASMAPLPPRAASMLNASLSQPPTPQGHRPAGLLSPSSRPAILSSPVPKAR